MAKKANEMALELKFIRPIKISEVPVISKHSVINGLEEFKELVKLAEYIAKEGIGEYEAFDVADFNQIKKASPQAAKMKTLTTSFVTSARRVLKQFGVEKKLSLKMRMNRLYVVAAE
jgi:hypothetical protein